MACSLKEDRMPSKISHLPQLCHSPAEMNQARTRTCVNVAGFRFALESGQPDQQFVLPECFRAFVCDEGIVAPQPQTSVIIHPPEVAPDEANAQLICETDVWELKQGERQELVFTTKRSKYPRTLKIQQDYTRADLYGRTIFQDGGLRYPLENLDMLMMVNWLAERADLILHASGVVLEGKCFAFPGASGVGKSTLAAALKKNHNALVQGEDQVILRFLENDFWSFGTPWHQNEAMCSPVGAKLGGVVFLDRSAERGIHRISAVDGAARLMQSAFIPFYRPELIPAILDRLSSLAEAVPFFCLNYSLGQDVYLEYLQPQFFDTGFESV